MLEVHMTDSTLRDRKSVYIWTILGNTILSSAGSRHMRHQWARLPMQSASHIWALDAHDNSREELSRNSAFESFGVSGWSSFFFSWMTFQHRSSKKISRWLWLCFSLTKFVYLLFHRVKLRLGLKQFFSSNITDWFCLAHFTCLQPWEFGQPLRSSVQFAMQRPNVSEISLPWWQTPLILWAEKTYIIYVKPYFCETIVKIAYIAVYIVWKRW